MKLAEPLSATTIVIAGRHGQERISFRMLLPSEPLSRAMLSSSVCHAPPSMSSWVFACPHRQQPSQGHATSRGKSMMRHIGCLFQRRLCSCADSLVDLPGRFVRRIRGPGTMSYFLTINGKWRRIVAVCSEAEAHPGKVFIQRHSRIHDFVLKHGFLHMICVWAFGMLVAGIASIFLSSFGLDDYWHKDCGK